MLGFEAYTSQPKIKGHLISINTGIEDERHPPLPLKSHIFAEFIAIINYLDNNGITTEPNMIYNRHKYRLSYFFEYAPLKTVVKSVLAPLFESIKNGEFENDDLTRIEYEDTLKQFNVPIIQH